jgi:DNA-binding NtrC family response regulator
MGASILVVDDEPVVQRMVKSLLHTQGYDDVATAGDGEEALTRLDRRPFDVLVSDIRMPGLSGLEVLERSRALHPRLGVILMTGYADVDTAIEAFRRGATDYLRKPFEPDDLKLSVERALRGRRTAVGGAGSRGRHRAAGPAASPPRGLRAALLEFEQRCVEEALAEAHFDKRRAARLLGISLASLYRKLGAEP